MMHGSIILKMNAIKNYLKIAEDRKQRTTLHTAGWHRKILSWDEEMFN